jgi:hypothetical protein
MAWKLTKSNVGKALKAAMLSRHEYLPSPRGTVRGGYGRWQSGYELHVDGNAVRVQWVASSLSGNDDAMRRQTLYGLDRCRLALEPHYSVTSNDSDPAAEPYLIVTAQDAVASGPGRAADPPARAPEDANASATKDVARMLRADLQSALQMARNRYSWVTREVEHALAQLDDPSATIVPETAEVVRAAAEAHAAAMLVRQLRRTALVLGLKETD